MAQFNMARIRDLILDFYAEVDPERLERGIDVNGMAQYTMEHGLENLNEMLRSQYNQEIDPRKELNMSTKEAVIRVSHAVSGPAAMKLDHERRIEIAEKLQKFYEKHDRSKLGGLKKLVEFAMYKGVAALNQKLMEKYNEDLRIYDPKFAQFSEVGTEEFEPRRPLPPKPPKRPSKTKSSGPGSVKSEPTEPAQVEPVVEAPVEPISPKSPVVDTPKVVVDPVRESRSVMDAMSEIDVPDETEFMAEVEKFYAAFDPSKLDVIEALQLWAAQLGRDEFSKKMVQIYGASLDSPIPEKKPEEKKETLPPLPPLPPVEVKDIETAPPPINNRNTFRAAKVEPRTEKPSFQRFNEALNKSVKKADPYQGPKLVKSKEDKEGACDNYRLDMTGKMFGVCKCGYAKTSHSMW